MKRWTRAAGSAFNGLCLVAAYYPLYPLVPVLWYRFGAGYRQGVGKHDARPISRGALARCSGTG